ncbi:MAG: hydroxyphenylacetyl-CoA thioesterase PaaI [Ottowia sp.]|nr:hydroxyphenylacetyl-CoA thioesterase PaaI [Ottowia sp.]
MTETHTAQQLAERVCKHLYAQDHASRALGMHITQVAPGQACLTMHVRADMLNGYHTCHGGLITALADSAFAFACNSRNVLTVASGLSVEFIVPAQQDDVLTAYAKETANAGKTGVVDVNVYNQHEVLVAVFRGRAHRLSKPVINE